LGRKQGEINMHKMNEICEELAYLAESYLNLERWKFQESARLSELGDLKVPFVIYNSQVCRMKISFNEWHPPHQTKDYTVDVYYGKLHAPNDRSIILSGNKECHCWHGVTKVLHFLDGRTPEDAAKNLFSHDLIKEYRKLVSSDSLSHKLPEWEIRKHAYIWEEYAPRLFELFDLRNIDLWERYQLFLKEIYDIKGRNPNIAPPLDSVC
jgi:hypothetical protein